MRQPAALTCVIGQLTGHWRRYTARDEDDLESLERDMNEESGWKLVRPRAWWIRQPACWAWWLMDLKAWRMGGESGWKLVRRLFS